MHCLFGHDEVVFVKHSSLALFVGGSVAFSLLFPHPTKLIAHHLLPGRCDNQPTDKHNDHKASATGNTERPSDRVLARQEEILQESELILLDERLKKNHELSFYKTCVK